MNKVFVLEKEIERYKNKKNLFYMSFILVVSISIFLIFFSFYNMMLLEKNNNTIYLTKYPKIYSYIICGALVIICLFGKELISQSLKLNNLKKTFNNPELYFYYLAKYGNSTSILESAGSYTFIPMKTSGTNDKLGTLNQIYPKNIYQIVKENYLKNINGALRKPMTKEEKARIIFGLAGRFKGPNFLYKAYLQMESVSEGKAKDYINYFEDIWYNDYKNFNNFSPKVKKLLEKKSREQLKNDWDVNSINDLNYILKMLLKQTYDDSPSNLEKVHTNQDLEDVKTFIGFDLGRYANIIRNAIYSGYLKDDQIIEEYIDKAYVILISNFSNYLEFAESYLAGICLWNHESYFTIKNWMLYLLLNPYSPANQKYW